MRACDDRFERRLLVGGVALDRLDQVRDQVVPALELHADLRPRVVDPVPQPDEAVVPGDEHEHDQDDDHDDDDYCDHVRCLPLGRPRPG